MNFYHTQKWRKKRIVILKKYDYRCYCCSRFGFTSLATTVHHITPISDDFSKALKNDNLVALCAKCHEKCHNRDTDTLTEFGLKLIKKEGLK
jgi:5-methylcytosine-specific restriction enzyme A